MLAPAAVVRSVCAALSWVLLAGVAHADPSATDKALAEQLFRDGKELMGLGKIPQACAKLADSERYDPQPGTLLNLALCHEQEGRTASAWVEFGDAASLASRANEPERASFARKRAAVLEAKLSRLRVRVTSSAPGLTVRIDGVVLAASALGEAVPLDPGNHTIDASAPGKAAFARTVTIAEGPGSAEVVVAPLESAPVPPPLPRDAGRSGGGRTLAFVALGVGVAGLAVGSYFGVSTLAKKNDESSYCDATNCSPPGIADQNAARTDATLSTIGFGAGLVAAGAFVALLAVSGSPKSPASAVWVAPQVAARGAGFGLGGRW